jgi:hypothetical protein
MVRKNKNRKTCIGIPKLCYSIAMFVKIEQKSASNNAFVPVNKKEIRKKILSICISNSDILFQMLQKRKKLRLANYFFSSFN